MAASKSRTRRSEKDAWEWIDSVDCNAITREHLEKAYRINATCGDKGNHRKNCKFNPNCLTCLGERFWMKELKDDIWCEKIEDPDEQKREEGSFVGLKNLGATCYVNTLVQVWFHNEEFRSALYSWVPLDGEPPSPEKDVPVPHENMETDQAVTMNDKDESTEHLEGKENSETQESEQPVSQPCDQSNLEFEKISSNKLKNEKHENSESTKKPSIVCPPIPLCKPWEDSKEPKSFCRHLQLLLAQLQYTSRRYVDPAPFVGSLGLDIEQQQDAQEFSKLFMSLLEDTLSQQPNPIIKNIVQQQFGGSYVYITRCSKCGKQSQRSSTFYELDLNIQGNTNLSQCIKEFLKEEDLHGDNQYHCSFCMSKQDATRYIKLQELPPVLNLQLLRFVFDRKSGCKKKLNTTIWFPEVLNMKEYVDANMEGCVYDLTAVLIHRGLSAYSGHYVAHIKDKKSGVWYRFNDETTEKMKGKSLNLEAEEDLHEAVNGGTAAKRPKLSKGSSSKDAYMLVYRQRGEEKEAVAQEPPPTIQMLVAEDNSRMDQWSKQVQQIRDTMASVGRQRQIEVQKTLEILPVAEGDECYDWVATDWLRSWLAVERKEAAPIDNSSLICQHGKLHPDKVLCAKRISTKAASFLYKRYGGSPRLESDSFCLDCVKERCRSLQFSSHLAEDQKFFAKALRVSCEKSGFWVSKKSLQKWKVLAQKVQEQLSPNGSSSPSDESTSTGTSRTPDEAAKRTMTNSDTLDETKPTRGDESPEVVDMDTEGKRGTSGSEVGSVGADDKEELKFNEDLLCEHGCLSTSTASRLVTVEVWKRLRFYFPEAPEFSWRETACPVCNVRDLEEAKRIEELRELASQQKSILGSLFNERERPEFEKKVGRNSIVITKAVPHRVHSSLTAYALSRSFYEDWRKFIRTSHARRTRPSRITNKILVCPHDKFLYHPRCGDNDGASSALIYLWDIEWEVLSQAFGFDVEIKIVRDVFEENCIYSITPDCCVECNAALVAEHFTEGEVYENANIYVRKITDKHGTEDVQGAENQSPVENSNEDTGSLCDKSVQFIAGNTPKAAGDCRRRSSRHRKQRGEVMITVDSSETVRDIKLELMKLFSVMPLDQHLSVNGKNLEDDKTLGAAGVGPGSILLLKVDEPQDGIAQEELSQASRQPEQGFKGTGLLKHPLTI